MALTGAPFQLHHPSPSVARSALTMQRSLGALLPILLLRPSLMYLAWHLYRDSLCDPWASCRLAVVRRWRELLSLAVAVWETAGSLGQRMMMLVGALGWCPGVDCPS